MRRLAWLVLFGGVASGEEDPAASLSRLEAEPRRAERRDVVALAEAADRLAAGGSASAWRIAGDLYLRAYRGFRDRTDLSTALDRLEHAARSDGVLACNAALAVARVHAELGSLEAGFLAFHRVARRCPEGLPKEEADRALAILAPFRPGAEAIAAVDRDPTAAIGAMAMTAHPAADAGPPVDAGRPTDAGPATTAPDAAPPMKRGPGKMIIRFSDGGG